MNYRKKRNEYKHRGADIGKHTPFQLYSLYSVLPQEV